MKSVALLALAVSSASAFAPSQCSSCKSVSVEATRSDILSTPIGPETGGKIFDPLGLSELGSDETISWFRHSEIKHGRIAMAAFVGWCVAGAGLRLPGELAPGLSFSDIPSKGLEAWDAIPGWGKAQFLIFAGLIEFHDELFFSRRGTHYMRGGTPGKVCATKKILDWRCESNYVSHTVCLSALFPLQNMVPGLYDPLGFSKNRSEEAKANGRVSEIKNGRLAMIGVAGLYAAATIPGSVPLQPDC
jgi:hypothetical protein